MVVSKKEMMPAASDKDSQQERMPFAKRMPEASDNGSQPYRKAFRFFEMAGMGLPQQ